MIYFQNDRITIRWDEDAACVMSCQIGFADGAVLRTAADKILTLLKEKGAERCLNDLRLMKVLAEDDQRWFVEDWSPRARAAGLRFYAMVLPRSVVAGLSVDSVVSKTGDTMIRIGYFSDPEVALKWLLEQG